MLDNSTAATSEVHQLNQAIDEAAGRFLRIVPARSGRKDCLPEVRKLANGFKNAKEFFPLLPERNGRPEASHGSADLAWLDSHAKKIKTDHKLTKLLGESRSMVYVGGIGIWNRGRDHKLGNGERPSFADELQSLLSAT